MTLDDKKKCSEMWKMASDQYIAPVDWTDSAGDELAKFYASVYRCSVAMSFVPRPSGSAPGWGWIVKQAYNVLKNRYNMNKSLVFQSCQVMGLSVFKETIPAKCL